MPTASMIINEEQVIDLYIQHRLTLREIAGRLGTNHHRVKRILVKNNIPITNKRTYREFSAEHRRKISESCKGRKGWSKGLVMTEAFRRKDMRGKLGGLIDVDRYPDFERLRILTYVSSKHRKYFETPEKRQAFLDRFYFDPTFNAIYDKWIASGKNKWFYPSLDHINPKSNGGSFDLDNLCFLTWFENRAKADMPLEEWNAFKLATHTTSDLFV